MSTEQTIWQTAMVASPQTVAAVIGGNLRRLREQRRLTQHGAVHLLRRYDLRWSRSKLDAIEGGRRQEVTVTELLALAMVFNVQVAEFFVGDGVVQLTNAELGRNLIREVLRGNHVREDLQDLDPEARMKELLRAEDLITATEAALHPDPTEADEELARKLGLPLKTVTEAAYAIWDRTMTEERDVQTAGLGDMTTGERTAHRGHITRELARRLEMELTSRGVMSDSRRGKPPNAEEAT
ncbi:helix-turn-helix domain-containing protein [Amycolatopsis rhizosphaerae]|uniref:Helix-turn-helix domain-containing protein n=1 Tax=Amycolatopsis rhizosphaerae TaxID=2053003 RepID=A0A558DLX7_9PSEU|nr:helix-turn-helix domain-containing protein [Amycolatopsis rhizosphaerae]TVT61983.1 helix-turn-helix domain-containing protein [Amycolatopsis rhizosphaerae]